MAEADRRVRRSILDVISGASNAESQENHRSRWPLGPKVRKTPTRCPPDAYRMPTNAYLLKKTGGQRGAL